MKKIFNFINQFLPCNVIYCTLLLAVYWQLALLVIGIAIDPSQGMFGHMIHWDAGWYKNVIEYGYSLKGSPAAPAFYPLYPFLVKLLTIISFRLISLELSAFIINTISLWFLLTSIVAILRRLGANKYGIGAAILVLLSFPSAFFMHVFYTEALFIALGFGAYLFALKKNWKAVGILLALITAARLPGILFILLCGLEYLRVHEWNIKKALNQQIAWLLLAPLGLIAYGSYLYFIRKNAFAMFSAYHATADWGYQVFNPNIFHTIWVNSISGLSDIIHARASYEPFINRLLPVASLITVFVSSIYLLLKRNDEYIPIGITGFASIVMFTLNSNLISAHRYVLGCICIYVAAAIICKTSRLLKIIGSLCLLSLAVQIFLYTRFIDTIFAG